MIQKVKIRQCKITRKKKSIKINQFLQRNIVNQYIMNEAFPQLFSKQFSELYNQDIFRSMSKLNMILKPSPKIDVNSKKLQDLIISIFSFEHNYIEKEELSDKLKKIQLQKECFYSVVERVIDKKLKNYIKTIQSIIKMHLSKKDQAQQQKPRKQITHKIFKLLVSAFDHVKEATENVQLFLRQAEEQYQWGCYCKRDECENRVQPLGLLKQIFRLIVQTSVIIRKQVKNLLTFMEGERKWMFDQVDFTILPNFDLDNTQDETMITTDEIELKREQILRKQRDLRDLMDYDQIQFFEHIKQLLTEQLETYDFSQRKIDMEIPYDEDCIQPVEQQEESKSKKKRKKKNKNKNKNKQPVQIKDEQDKQIEQMEQYLQNLNIDDIDRCGCYVEQEWVTRIKPENYFRIDKQ